MLSPDFLKVTVEQTSIKGGCWQTGSLGLQGRRHSGFLWQPTLAVVLWNSLAIPPGQCSSLPTTAAS